MRPRSNMKLNPEDLAKITDFTLSHYNEHAEDSPCADYATAAQIAIAAANYRPDIHLFSDLKESRK